MLNLNSVEMSESSNAPLELIKDKTPVRAMINFTGGDIEIPEFSKDKLFKKSQHTSAMWAEMEFTIIGGEYDKRRVWHRLFVHGDKLDNNGVPVARNIGLETLRKMVDSIHGLRSTDMTPEAQVKRNLSSLTDLQGQQFSFLVGVEPEQNGYPAKNKMTVVLTPDDNNYVSGNAVPAMGGAPVAQPAAAAPAGVVPQWANNG